MATKRIQLRGISRTPSDRLTNDGGCAESLNVQLDNTEVASSFYPKEVTTALGAPENAEFYFSFIHKGGAYENLIYAAERELGYFKDNEPVKILDLEDGDVIEDASSVGNSVIVKGKLTTYYLLYKEGGYLSLGPQVPFPILDIKTNNATYNDEIDSTKISPWSPSSYGSQEVFNVSTNDMKKTLTEQVREQYKSTLDRHIPEHFSTIRFVRYAVELFDGTLISSIPFMVGNLPTVVTEEIVPPADYEEMEYQQTNRILGNDYSIQLKLPHKDVFKGWEHIVNSVNIYLSPPVIPDNEEMLIKAENWTVSETQVPEGIIKTTRAVLKVGTLFTNPEEIMFYAAQCKEVKSIKIFEEDTFKKEVYTEDYEKLCDGIEFTASEEYSFTNLASKDSIKDDDIQHYPTLGEKYSSYNSRLLALSPEEAISYVYDVLPGIVNTNNKYLAQFHLLTDSGEKIVEKEVIGSDKFFFFPDTRCYRVDLFDSREATSCQSYEMKTFAYMEGAFYLNEGHYVGIEESYGSLIVGPPAAAQIYDARSNYLYMSESENLFTFPDATKYQFQSKVIGVAVATTALSQGQFGQFPLYVFTEDGIWAMETGADGTFVTKKPLSREVCINPNSICAVDSAVVFVTAQGVMLLQGSQVTNISPFMNGKHYTIEESARNIVEGQEEFSSLLSTISDGTHFMAFVKEASVAYDYAGRRLVFIKKGEQYQYIYKLDTQTWHKSAYGVDLIAPLNSYPECLVQSGQEGELIRIFWKVTELPAWDPTFNIEYFKSIVKLRLPEITEEQLYELFDLEKEIEVTGVDEEALNALQFQLEDWFDVITTITKRGEPATFGKIYDLSTILDAAEEQTPTKGIIATRSLDLDEPDVYKTITDVRIRGQFRKGAVKFILLGSNDGVTFSAISTLRGKAWKLFRIIILADLQPTERISWIDVQYETRFTNRLR